MPERTLNRNFPTVQQLRSELNNSRRKREYRSTLRSVIYILLVVAAISVLLATRALPVLQFNGSSMEPSLSSGQIVLALRNAELNRKDIVAFYYNNKILVKRVIGLPGDYIDIDKNGNVSVNGVIIEEPYLNEKSLGTCDIDLPYQVPEGRIFVMGDQRASSMDSRTKAIGCIADEFIVGKVVFSIWPFEKFGKISF